MNKSRMLELADTIEAAPRQKFDMHTFLGKFKLDRAGRRRRLDVEVVDPLTELRKMPCGTSACIAGWAVHLHPRAGLKDAYGTYGSYDTESHARAILDLTPAEANSLFYGRMDQNNKQAAAFIRRCVELGAVPE